MKAKNLAKILLEYPEFEVKFIFMDKDNSDWGLHLRQFIIDTKSIDIGHSDKIISISGEEK